jgi:hypothetical protein
MQVVAIREAETKAGFRARASRPNEWHIKWEESPLADAKI